MMGFCTLCGAEFGIVIFDDGKKAYDVVFHYYEFHRDVFNDVINSGDYSEQDITNLIKDYEQRLQNKFSK